MILYTLLLRETSHALKLQVRLKKMLREEAWTFVSNSGDHAALCCSALSLICSIGSTFPHVSTPTFSFAHYGLWLHDLTNQRTTFLVQWGVIKGQVPHKSNSACKLQWVNASHSHSWAEMRGVIMRRISLSSTLQDLAYCGAWERESLRDPMPVPRYFWATSNRDFQTQGQMQIWGTIWGQVLGLEGWAVSRSGSRLRTTIWSTKSNAEK